MSECYHVAQLGRSKCDRCGLPVEMWRFKSMKSPEELAKRILWGKENGRSALWAYFDLVDAIRLDRLSIRKRCAEVLTIKCPRCCGTGKIGTVRFTLKRRKK